MQPPKKPTPQAPVAEALENAMAMVPSAFAISQPLHEGVYSSSRAVPPEPSDSTGALLYVQSRVN